jgi:hypothetical protein
VSVIEHLSPQVTICHGPTMEEASRTPMGVKWCFKCRSRNEFQWIVIAPVIDWNNEASIAAAYWGPVAHSECGRCKKHGGELFPGWEYAEMDD